MNLIHFYAKNWNMGDWGSALGIRQLLLKEYHDIGFTEINIDRDRPSFLYRRKLAKKHDGIVIGGGGLLVRNKRMPEDWYFNLKGSQLQKMEIPYFVFGIGYNQEISNDNRWQLSNTTKQKIKAFLQGASAIGVRDPESVQFLQDLGLRDVYLTPCPSMNLAPDVPINHESDIVAINLTHRNMNLDSLFSTMTQVISVLNEKNLNPVFVVHNYPEDQRLFPYIRKLDIPIFNPVSPYDLMAFYKKSRFLLGMRGHSLIFATGAELPMIGLSYNVKIDYHMKMINQEAYLIPFLNVYDPDLIIQKIEQLEKNKDRYEKELNTTKLTFFKHNQSFVQTIINHLTH